MKRTPPKDRPPTSPSPPNRTPSESVDQKSGTKVMSPKCASSERVSEQAAVGKQSVHPSKVPPSKDVGRLGRSEKSLLEENIKKGLVCDTSRTGTSKVPPPTKLSKLEPTSMRNEFTLTL